MAENFNDRIDRLHSDSVKWNVYGEDVLPMWVADMDFLSPPAVIEALQRRVKHGVFGYAMQPPHLDDAVMRWAQQHYHLSLTKEEFLYVPGVVTGINLAARALLKPGEGILYQPPIYPPFFEVAENGGFIDNPVDLVENEAGQYTFSVEDLYRNILPDTRMFLLCNPHNPVGRVFTRGELEQIVAFCKQNDLFICSDEIHCDLIYPPAQHIPIISLGQNVEERTVMLFAPSKTFNIAGLGFSVMVVKDPHLMQTVKRKLQGILPHPDLLAAQAADAAYQHGEEWLREMTVYLQENRDYLAGFLASEMPDIKMNKPEGTFLAWLDCRSLPFGDDPYSFFLKNARVALNNGADFGSAGKGFVRLNFACPRSILEEGLQKMAKAYRSFR